MAETLAHGYSSESTQRELSNKYHHDRVEIFKNLCVVVLRMKVASALEGLMLTLTFGPLGTFKAYLSMRCFKQPGLESSFPNKRINCFMQQNRNHSHLEHINGS